MRETTKQPAATAEDANAEPSATRVEGRTVSGRLFRVRSGHGWHLTTTSPPPEPAPVRRPARIARILALAHRLDRAIRNGQVADRATLAREVGVTRARISQLLNLTLLAPDIQEELLFAEAVDGREPISMRSLRPLTRKTSWREQRKAWRELPKPSATRP